MTNAIRTTFSVIVTGILLLGLSTANLRPRPQANPYSSETYCSVINATLLDRCGMDGHVIDLFTKRPKKVAADLVFAVTSAGMRAGGPLVHFAMFKDMSVIVADGRSKSGFYSWKLNSSQFNHYLEMIQRLQAVKDNDFGNDIEISDLSRTSLYFTGADGKARKIGVYGIVTDESWLMPIQIRMEQHALLPMAVVDAYFAATTAKNSAASEWLPEDLVLNFSLQNPSSYRAPATWSPTHRLEPKMFHNRLQLAAKDIDNTDLLTFYRLPSDTIATTVEGAPYVIALSWEKDDE